MAEFRLHDSGQLSPSKRPETFTRSSANRGSELTAERQHGPSDHLMSCGPVLLFHSDSSAFCSSLEPSSHIKDLLDCQPSKSSAISDLHISQPTTCSTNNAC